MAANNVTHPKTIYSHLSTSELHSMYDQDTWKGLNPSERLSLMQETVNREAIEQGNLYSCKVAYAALDPTTAGEQSGDRIYINYNMYAKDSYTVEYDGKPITYSRPCNNFDCYETLIHEYTHIKQDKIAEGTVPADPDTRALFQANGFTVSDIDGKRGSQYLFGESDSKLYYGNPTEINAFRVSQEKTQALISELNASLGEKSSNAAYIEQLKTNDIEVILAECREHFNNPNFETEVANTLMNKHHGTNIRVDPELESIVENEMVLSQQVIDAEMKLSNLNTTNNKEENTMSNNKWHDMHVSHEIADNTLRGTVNDAYVHMKNDPSISNEEAISNAAQMSEGYLTYMSEFDAAQNSSATQTAAGNIASAETGASGGVTSDSGAVSVGDEGSGGVAVGGDDDSGGISGDDSGGVDMD